jgi:PKD repeat protein
MLKKIVVPILCMVIVMGILSGCVEEEPTNQTPNAMFSYSPTMIYRNTEITFDDTSTDDGTIEAWLWDFGDGTTSTEQNPTYSYDEVGDYTVSLNVTDDKGAVDEYSTTITVDYIPPTAMFTYDPMVNITTATEIAFTDNSTAGDFNITSWLWDFGEGNTTNTTNATYTFAVAGNYTVSLTVTDTNDATNAYEVVIEVTEAA